MGRFTITVFISFLIFIAISACFNASSLGSVQHFALDNSEIKDLQEAIKAYESSIEGLVSNINSLKTKIAANESQIKSIETELLEIELRFLENVRVFGSRVRSAYIKGGSYLNALFEADNFGELIVRAVYLKKILFEDSLLIATIRKERSFIEERKDKMDHKARELQEMQYAAEAEYKNLVALRQQKEDMLKEARTKLLQREPVYGVVIDNHSDARPQSGLSDAIIVYEYEVEGRITRYLALFSVFPSKVGPVRSARTHSAVIAHEHNVRYIHAGGTIDVLQTFQEWGLRSTNALASPSSAFYRDSTRSAPHNLYVNLSSLKQEQTSGVILIRPPHLTRQGSPGTNVSLQISSSLRIQYRYVSHLAGYQRHVNDKVYRDTQGNNIVASNIIIQYVRYGLDFYSRPTPELVGSGNIDFYCQGQHFRGTWQKDSIDSPTRFYYLDGSEIVLVSGQTWIHLLRN